MTDIQTSPAPAAPQGPVTSVVSDENRTMALVVYGLFLVALFSGGLAGIAGLIVAYVKRGEARGTIWESHFDNQISTFWATFVLCIVGALTIVVFGLGLLILGAAFVWFLYRTVKGLVAAIEWKPYVCRCAHGRSRKRKPRAERARHRDRRLRAASACALERNYRRHRGHPCGDQASRRGRHAL